MEVRARQPVGAVASRPTGPDYARLIAATMLAGLLSGLGAAWFHFAAVATGETLFDLAEADASFGGLPVVVIVPTVGLLLVGLVLQRVPESRMGGVRDVLESLQRRAGVVPLFRLLNVLLSGVVLAVGGSVGPEGPMVQMGAVAGSWVGKRLALAREQLRTVVRAGVAAGIAAAFQSPAGGVLLTVEMFGARFNQDLAAVAIAAGLGYATRTALVGAAYPFSPPEPMQPLPLAGLVFVVPIVGLLAGLTGHLFIRMFERVPALFPRQWPLAANVALGGLIVGVLGLRFPQVLSTGYPLIERSLHGAISLDMLVLLLFLKMIATSVTFGSGAVGGLFAPTLVIGALYGGALGYAFHDIAPQAVPQPELFVLLGMVVMFGSVVKCYWSGLFMVADLTGCYHQLLLPGMVGGGISFFVGWALHDRSILGLPVDPSGSRASPLVD